MTRMTTMRVCVAGSVLATCLFIGAPAFAEVIAFKSNLSAAAEVPPNDSTATGAVTITFDTSSKKLSWQGNFAGLTGPAIAGHFHGPAEPGKNASVAVPINPGGSPFQGSADLTDAQASDLLAGRWYVNIHTDAHKGGELRGQVLK